MRFVQDVAIARKLMLNWNIISFISHFLFLFHSALTYLRIELLVVLPILHLSRNEQQMEYIERPTVEEQKYRVTSLCNKTLKQRKHILLLFVFCQSVVQ